MPRREAAWSIISGCLSQWYSIGTRHSSEVLANRIQGMEVRWKELNRRLQKWHECLKNMRKDNEALLLEFETLAEQVKGWMNGAEAKISEIKTLEDELVMVEK